MQHVLLKDVTQESHRWRIRVRVTRFSEYIDVAQPGKVLRLDVVLLDEQGTKMEAQIPERHLYLFSTELKEDHVYYIEYFEVANAKITYQAVDYPFMSIFTRYTKIAEISPIPDTFPLYAYEIASFHTLRTRIGQKRFLSVLARGTMKSVRNIKITDGRDTATVALWGPHAEQFDAQQIQAESTQGPVVALFVAMTVNIYEGQLSLQGNSICKWYTNIPIPEIAALQNSFSSIPHSITWFGQSAEQSRPLSTTVNHLSTLNAHDAVGRSYNVDIIIEDLTPNSTWWYLACSECRKTTTRVGESYKCPRCNAVTAEPRYKVLVRGRDIEHADEAEAQVVEFVFFGDIGQQLIGIPPLILTADTPNIPGFIPPEITRLYGKRYSLRVSGSRGSLQSKTTSFQVDAFSVLPTAPPAILTPVTAQKLLEYSMPIHDDAPRSSVDAPLEHALLPTSSVSPQTPILQVHAKPQHTTTSSTPPTDLPKDPSKARKRPYHDDSPQPPQTGDDTSAIQLKKKGTVMKKLDMDMPNNE